MRDAAWKRVLAEKEREIEKLVGQGKLAGKRKGRRLLVNVGSFYDRLGEPPPLVPNLGSDFAVFPDERAEEVRRLQEEHCKAQETLLEAPLRLIGESYGTEHRSGDDSNGGDAIAEALVTTLRERIQARWQELRAVELFWEEAIQQFEGEDPVRPEIRQALDDSKRKLEELHESLQSYGEPFALPEPGEKALAEVRKIAQAGEEV